MFFKGLRLFLTAAGLVYFVLLCFAVLALALRGLTESLHFRVKGGKREFTVPLSPRLRPAVAPSVTLSGPKK